MSKFENILFSNILNNEEYAKKVIPFLKSEYFKENSDKVIFGIIEQYVENYKKIPTKKILDIELENVIGITDDTFKESKELITSLESESNEDMDWLVDKTEKFCRDKALYLAIMETIKIVDSNDKQENISVGNIPKILSDALAVSFDSSVGHDYLDDYEARYAYYHKKEYKVPFDIEFFNKITGGGVSRKTLTIALAPTGSGKSLFMCHCAAHNLIEGRNVLYISLEMSEEKVAERIDANLMDVSIGDIKDLPKHSFDAKIQRVKAKVKGKLIIKEYPTSAAGSANFRHLLNELRLKKSFKPDIIYIDYINICCSSRLKPGVANSYSYIKAIVEELRGLAVEFDVPIITATQVNREGFNNSDIDLTNTSESMGTTHTADLMFALMSTPELEKLNQVLIKQLKNRYGALTNPNKFTVGIDRAKMRLYDVEPSAQQNLSKEDDDDSPLMDKTTFGSRDMKEKFKGFK